MKRFLILLVFIGSACASDSDKTVIFRYEDSKDNAYWNKLCEHQEEYRKTSYAKPEIVAIMDNIENEINKTIGQDSTGAYAFSLFIKPDIRQFIDYTLNNFNDLTEGNKDKFREVLYLAAPMAKAHTRLNRIIDLIPNRDRYSVKRDNFQYRRFCIQMYRLRAIEQARIMNFELAEASELAVIYIRNGEEIAKHMRDDMYDGDLLENMGGMAYGSYLEVIFPNFMDWMEPYRRLFGK